MIKFKTPKGLSKKDLKLAKRCQNATYIDCDFSLSDKAKSPKLKEAIRKHMIHLYHVEESKIGEL